jgi:hypothetical protein
MMMLYAPQHPTHKLGTMRKATSKGMNLEAMVSEGSADSAYEALQLYKSKVHRARSKSNFQQSLEICTTGAVLLFKYRYESAGTELARLFVEILEEANAELTPEYRNLLNSIDTAYNSLGSDHATDSHCQFLKECLKYSARVGSRVYGDTLLHTRLAECLWTINEQRFVSMKHFALGEAPERLWRQVRMAFICLPFLHP